MRSCVLVVLACLAAGCSPARGVSIAALGDSVPRGTNCGCTPYPQLTAEAIGARADNDSVAGATSASVLEQLDTDPTVVADVRRAAAVEIEIGANDVGYSQACGTDVACYAPRLPALDRNLAAIVARTRALTSGHIVLLDYWNVWLGGRYAAAKGRAYVDASEELTDRVDAIIAETAAETGSQYVDLRAAFKGPDYSYDETHFLASDGDHPNAAGHRRIAAAVEVTAARGRDGTRARRSPAPDRRG